MAKFCSVLARSLGKIFCTAALLFLGTTLGSAPASAVNYSHIMISPTTLTVTLDPGQVYHGSFMIKNNSDFTDTFYPIARPYSVQGSDYIPSYDEEDSAYSQIFRWVTFARSEYSLEPGAETQVEFTVTVPTDVPAGGQYAALLLESKGDGQAMFNANTRVGPLLLAQVNGETRLEGSHHGQQMTQFVTFGPFVAQASFDNPGNVDYKVISTLTARNFFTGNYDFDNTENPSELLVFPGKPRTIGVSWPEQPLIGIYNIDYTINYLDDDYTLSRVVIFCPIWVILLFIGLIVFMIIYGVLDRKKRRHPWQS